MSCASRSISRSSALIWHWCLRSRPGVTCTRAATVEMGHGRIAQRMLPTSAALAGLSTRPGLAQG